MEGNKLRYCVSIGDVKLVIPFSSQYSVGKLREEVVRRIEKHWQLQGKVRLLELQDESGGSLFDEDILSDVVLDLAIVAICEKLQEIKPEVKGVQKEETLNKQVIIEEESKVINKEEGNNQEEFNEPKMKSNKTPKKRKKLPIDDEFKGDEDEDKDFITTRILPRLRPSLKLNLRTKRKDIHYYPSQSSESENETSEESFDETEEEEEKEEEEEVKNSLDYLDKIEISTSELICNAPLSNGKRCTRRILNSSGRCFSHRSWKEEEEEEGIEEERNFANIESKKPPKKRKKTRSVINSDCDENGTSMDSNRFSRKLIKLPLRLRVLFQRKLKIIDLDEVSLSRLQTIAKQRFEIGSSEFQNFQFRVHDRIKGKNVDLKSAKDLQSDDLVELVLDE